MLTAISRLGASGRIEWVASISAAFASYIIKAAGTDFIAWYALAMATPAPQR
jgi:hypothetical protein